MPNMNEHPRGHLWAEHETNPAPEVMIHSAPEAVQIPFSNIAFRDDGANDAGPVHPDGDIAVPNDEEQTSQSKLKRRSRLWTWKTIIGICIGLLILAIVIPIMVTVVANDRGHDTRNTETTAIPSASQASYSFVPSTSSSAIPYPSSILNSVSNTPSVKVLLAIANLQ